MNKVWIYFNEIKLKIFGICVYLGGFRIFLSV